MKYTLIANLKSYKTLPDLIEWRDFLTDHLTSLNTDQLYLAPPFPYFHLFTSQFNLLSQDVSPFPPGSYTGAVNVDHLLDFNLKGSLVGHSERRRYFHETNQEISNKIDLLLDKQLLPVVCLNQTNLKPQLELLTPRQQSSCLFAYEPTSAIGSGNPADPSEVAETLALISQITSTPTVLYGGSVSVNNLDDYLNLPHFGGFLVGHASLNPQNLVQLVTKLQ